MKIDAHQHYWNYSVEDYGWIGDNMSVLKQDFLPVNLAPVLVDAGFDGTVAVQARQIYDETKWLLKLSDQSSIIKAVVGWVELCSENVRDQLRECSSHPRLRGVRHVLHDEPDDAFGLREDFVRGLAMLEEFNLAYDLLVFPKHLPLCCKIVEKFPNQVFVLDHIAKPLIKEGAMEPWEAGIRRLAQHPNVSCKVSGMVTEADWSGWKPEDFKPYLDVVFDCFGVDRLMIGSDWPVCTVSAPYANVMDIVCNYIGQLSPEQQAAVLGENARRIYQIPD
jgi:L-fuconolactonase